jgi:hypothetical protein
VPHLLHVFLEGENLVVAEPEVVSAAAVPSLEVVVSVLVEPAAFALVSAVVEPEAVSAAAEPKVGGGVVVAVGDVAEPQACGDIAVAFDASVPVSLFAVEVDSSEHPKLLAFPNVDHYAISSSSVEVVG